MIIMPVPKDVRKKKVKFIGGFTKRQTYALIPAGIIGYLLSNILRVIHCPSDLSVLLIFITIAPIILCGMIPEVYGMPPEIFLRDVLIQKMMAPKHRPYATENSYEKLAIQNKITYEYFDGDDKEYTEKEMKRKRKMNAKRLNRYLKEHPDMNPIQ